MPRLKKGTTRKLSQTAQACWSRRKKRAGCCTRCGEPRNRYKQLCDFHQGEFSAYMKAWRARRATELR